MNDKQLLELGIQDNTKDKKFIYLLVSEDLQTVVAFDGSEQDCNDLWQKMASCGHRITRICHTMIWDKDHNPFTNMDLF